VAYFEDVGHFRRRIMHLAQVVGETHLVWWRLLLLTVFVIANVIHGGLSLLLS